MHGPINVKSLNNIGEWPMEFNSAFKGFNLRVLFGIRCNMVSVGRMSVERCI
jgi:hypothetical protein